MKRAEHAAADARIEYAAELERNEKLLASLRESRVAGPSWPTLG
jgi:hypothetical protein